MTDDEWQRRHDVLHEALDTKLDTILEFVSVIPKMNERLGRVEGKVDKLEGDMVVVKDILGKHSTDLRTLKADMVTVKADLSEIKKSVGGHEQAIVALQAASHTH